MVTIQETAKAENMIAQEVVDASYKIYRKLGSGLLESAYECILVYELIRRGLTVRQQVPVPLLWDDLLMKECFRADLVVEERVLIELKSVERLAPVHKKQILTYLELTDMKLGLLVNFGAATFGDCVQRVVRGLQES